MAHPGDIAVLVVDGDPARRDRTVAALSSCCEPARIVAAGTAAQAQDFLFARGAYAGRDVRKPPRFVLLDLRLPDGDGIDILKAMRADPDSQGIPVIMLTAVSDKAELDRCYESGANSVVRHTDDDVELGRRMKQVYEFWVQVNEANRPSRV